MTKTEKNFYMNKKSVGYWSCMAGVEIKEILYDIDDYCVVCVGAWSSKKSIHKLKINYTNKGEYITVNGIRLYFSECLRID